jgi:hypothetical protein
MGNFSFSPKKIEKKSAMKYVKKRKISSPESRGKSVAQAMFLLLQL